MCMVEDGLGDGLKRVKAVQTSPLNCTLHTQKRSHSVRCQSIGPILGFLVMGDQSWVNQPVLQSLLSGFNIRTF